MTLSVVLAVCTTMALSSAGLIRLTAAEPIDSGKITQSEEEWSNNCLAGGGEFITIEDGNGNSVESSCQVGSSIETCNWSTKQCTLDVVQPTNSPLQDARPDGGVGGVFVDDTPTPTPGGRVLTEETPAPATTAAATAAATTTVTSAVTVPPAAASPAAPGVTPPSRTAPLGSASLTLVTATCAPGYDLFAPDADPARECPGPTDGIAFRLAGVDIDATRSSGDDGVGIATFQGLAAGSYLLTERLPEGTAFAFVLGCTSDVRTFASPFFPMAMVGIDGMLRISLQADETLTCDWFDVPAPDAPDLTVQVYDCGSAAPSVETCEPATESHRFVLAPVDGEGNPIAFETDGEGVAGLSGFVGTYTLSEVGRQPCAVESDGADGNANLVLGADREVTARVFHCGQ